MARCYYRAPSRRPSGILLPEAKVLESTVSFASYLFLAGVAVLFSSAVPAVRLRFPRAFAAGSIMALASLLVVLGAALVLR